MVSEHLDAALEHLEEAREEAGVGTAMMLADPIAGIRDVKRRFDNINDDDE